MSDLTYSFISYVFQSGGEGEHYYSLYSGGDHIYSDHGDDDDDDDEEESEEDDEEEGSEEDDEEEEDDAEEDEDNGTYQGYGESSSTLGMVALNIKEDHSK